MTDKSSSERAKSPEKLEDMSSCATSSKMNYSEIKKEAIMLRRSVFSTTDERTNVMLNWHEDRQAVLKDIYRYRHKVQLLKEMKKDVLKQMAVLNKSKEESLAEFEKVLKKDSWIKVAIGNIAFNEELVTQYEDNYKKKSSALKADDQKITDQMSSSSKELKNLSQQLSYEVNRREIMEQKLKNDHDHCENLVKKLNVEMKKYNDLFPAADQYRKALVNIENQKTILQKEIAQGAKLQDELTRLQGSLVEKQSELDKYSKKMDTYVDMNESVLVDLREKVKNNETETAEYLNKCIKSTDGARDVLEAEITTKTEVLDKFVDSANKTLNKIAAANENLIEMRTNLCQKKEILQHQLDKLTLSQQDSVAKLEMLEEQKQLQENIELKEKELFNHLQVFDEYEKSSESSLNTASSGTPGISTSESVLFKKPIPHSD